MRKVARKTTLSNLREYYGISQRELADSIGRSIHLIHRFEQGKLKITRPAGLKICERWGVSYNWLMNGGPDSPIAFDGFRTEIGCEAVITRMRELFRVLNVNRRQEVLQKLDAVLTESQP